MIYESALWLPTGVGKRQTLSRAGSSVLSSDACWDMHLFGLSGPQFHPINFKKGKDYFFLSHLNFGVLQQELGPIFSETLVLPSSDLPPLPFLFLHSWCYFKLRLPAKICTLLITCQLLCAMFNALSRLHQVCSESRRLTAAWVPGRLGGGPTGVYWGLLFPLLALNSVFRPSPGPACSPFKVYSTAC